MRSNDEPKQACRGEVYCSGPVTTDAKDTAKKQLLQYLQFLNYYYTYISKLVICVVYLFAVLQTSTTTPCM